MESFLSLTSGVIFGILVSVLFFMKKIISLNKEIATLTKEKEIQERYSVEFEQIAAKILKQNTAELSKTSKEELYNMLKPFKDNLAEFERKIELVRIEEAKGISSLETQIKLISENNKKICEEANNLTNALKGHAKIQGNWGEMILTRLLELSGLIEGQHFSLQESFKDAENKFHRPDVIIKLPDNRHLIVDSKVSLISYEKYYNSEKDPNFLKEFIVSVKEHVKGLKNRFYQEIKDINSPDYVLMFIPVEGAFNLVFQEDSNILDYAVNNKVLLVSPSTLLITLKTIELFWKQEKQTQNVMEIAEESGKLYDKFANLLSDMENIKLCIDKTSECFENVKRKLVGRGNLISQVEKLRELGAKTSKLIPDKGFDE